MTFPFASLVAEHRELGLLVAVAIGFGFGFVLERAGFGRAPKLAGQFYFTETTVLKVMFSAIVTAMLGMVVAAGLGLVDLAAVSATAASDTYLWPMIVGGLLLGAGFIVAGYCPGTSIVAAGSGNLDGLMTVAGVVTGTVVYSELMAVPAVAKFHASSSLGPRFLYQILHLPPAVVALAVVAMAVGAFLGAERLERFFTRRSRDEQTVVSPPRPRRAAFATFAALAVLGLGAGLALPRRATAAAPARPRTIDAAELTRRVLETPWRLHVVDVRPREVCAQGRVPGAECVPPEVLPKLGLAYDRTGRDLVLVGDADLAEIPGPARAYPGRVFVLAGGYPAFRAYALTAPPVPGPQASAAERDAYRLRAGIYSMMTGVKQAPPPPPPTGAPAPKRKGGGGCSG